MIINATQIRVGMILNVEGDLYRVTWTMHRTPGKGVACMQTKLTNLITSKNLEKRYRSDERVEKADLETRNMQYLYSEGEDCVFMDGETYDQHRVSGSLIGEGKQFLAEGGSYPVTFYEGRSVGVDLPQTVEFKVVMAPPDIKKATATATLKSVELENGLTIQAPGFIKEGDILKISTADGSYVERVKA